MFGMKKKRLTLKENIRYWNFLTNKKKDHSTIKQEIKLAEREPFLAKV